MNALDCILEEMMKDAFILLIIAAPLAIWKLIDIAIWASNLQVLR